MRRGLWVLAAALVSFLGGGLAVRAVQAGFMNAGSIALVRAVNHSERQGLSQAVGIFRNVPRGEKNSAVQRHLAFTCMTLHDWACARSAAEKGIALAPDDVLVNFYLGHLYAFAGELDSAVIVWRRAGAAPYFFHQGRYALTQGNIQKAIQHLKVASSIEPKISDAFYLLGRIQEEQGKWQEARENYAQAIANNHFVWHQVADVVMLARAYVGWGYTEYQTTRDLERATLLLKAATVLNPDEAWAFIRLCDVYRLAGDVAKALPMCNQAVQIMPNQPWSFFARARVFMLAGQYQQAKQDLETALAIDTSFQPAREALTQVLENLSGK